MALMLDRHSSITNPGEFDFLFDAFGPDGGLAAAQRLPKQEFDDFLNDDRVYLATPPRLREAGTALERLHEFVGRYAQDTACLALSIHRNFLSAHELFPQARFIHLLRDPRDCARSAVNAGFAGNVYHGLEPWLRSEESWDRLKPRLAPSQFMEVRYEELVSEPEPVLRRVCDFLGVSYEPRMMDLAGTTYEAPSPRFANQWRRNMSAHEVQLVEARVSEMMEARGYERAGRGAPGLGKAALLRLELQNAISRHRNGIRSYGASLWLQDIIARRLGMRAWERAVHLRMYPIKAKTLK